MMRPLLEARRLARVYSTGAGLRARASVVRAVDDVSFRLHAGTTLGIVGESGCGKSSLARMLALLDPLSAGELLIDGVSANALGGEHGRLRQAVQMVFQNPYASLNPRHTIGRILEEPLAINTARSAAERSNAARAMLARLGLRPEVYHHYPHMFSGGQRQRIAIGRALILDPRLVIADEPVSALDLSIQGQVLNLLMDLQEERGLAYVFISHDLDIVHRIADRIMVMYFGRAVESGDADLVFHRPAHPYTRALLASRPRSPRTPGRTVPILAGELPSPGRPPAGCAFHTRCPLASDRCRRERPATRTFQEREVACHHAEHVIAITEGT